MFKKTLCITASYRRVFQGFISLYGLCLERRCVVCGVVSFLYLCVISEEKVEEEKEKGEEKE